MFSLDTPEELLAHIREISPPENYRVRIKVLYATQSVHAEMTVLARAGVIRKLGDESTSGFQFKADIVGGGRETVFFAIVPTLEANASALVTVARREPWLALLREIKRQYPTLVPILLSQKELLQSVSTLQSKALSVYDLRVRELSTRESFASPEGTRIKSVREWTYEEWARALEVVSERRRIVISIGLDFHRRIGNHIDTVP